MAQRGIEDTAGDEGGDQHRKLAQPEPRGAGEQQDAAQVQPRATRRGSRRAGARTSRACGPSPSRRASSSPAATRNGTAPAGASTSIGISTSCVGRTLPAPTGNSTPARTAYRPTRTAAVARSNPAVACGKQQQRARGRDEQQRERDLGDELAARKAPRPAIPGLFEETIGRRLAAHVLVCAHSRLLSAERAKKTEDRPAAQTHIRGRRRHVRTCCRDRCTRRRSPRLRRCPRDRRRAAPTPTDRRSTG